MRRVKDYLKFIAWQTGLAYLLIWAVTFWTLDEGATVFGKSGVCLADQATVLFYWVCEATSPLSVLARIANFALTVTVWAPVYVAAATVKPDAMAIALPILALHVIGLPLGVFVLMRMMATALDLRRRIPGRGHPHEIGPLAAAPGAPAGAAAVPGSYFSTAPQRSRQGKAAVARPVRAVPPRSEFGLRGRKSNGPKGGKDAGRHKS
jgi:hypothetical protein